MTPPTLLELYRTWSMMLGMGGGARKRGRPRARWLDDIKAITNCTLNELCGLTRDRDAWREMVMEITRSRPRLDGTRFFFTRSHLARSDTSPTLLVVTPWVQSPIRPAASVHCMHIDIFNKVAVAYKLCMPKIRKNHRFMRMRTQT